MGRRVVLLGLPGAELLPLSLGKVSLGKSGSSSFLWILPLLSDFWLFFFSEQSCLSTAFQVTL